MELYLMSVRQILAQLLQCLNLGFDFGEAKIHQVTEKLF